LEISGDAKIVNRIGSYMSKIEEDPLKNDIKLPKVSPIYSAATFFYHRKEINSIALVMEKVGRVKS